MAEKYHVWAIFNKANGQFTGWSLNENITQSDVDVYRLESEKPINLKTLRWVGDFKTGKAVDTTNTPEVNDVVSESVLEQRMHERLFRKYAPSNIITAILDQFGYMVSKGAIEQGDLLIDMKNILDYYAKVDAKFTKDLAFFEKSKKHDFVNKQQEMENFEEAFKVEPVDPPT